MSKFQLLFQIDTNFIWSVNIQLKNAQHKYRVSDEELINSFLHKSCTQWICSRDQTVNTPERQHSLEAIRGECHCDTVCLHLAN